MSATLTKNEIRERRRHTPQLTAPDLWLAPLWPKNGDNLGTLLRTADAVGAGMFVPDDRPATRALRRGNTIGDGKVIVRTLHDPVASLASLAESMRIVAVEIAEGSVTPAQLAPVTGPTVLLLGHETLGIPAEAWEYVDEACEIPMGGVGNSLNVAVAGSVVAYALRGFYGGDT